MLNSLSFYTVLRPYSVQQIRFTHPFFLNFDDIEKLRAAFIQIRTPFSSEFLEKFSARVQIRTHALPFFFYFYS